MQPDIVENVVLNKPVCEQQSHTIAERGRPARQRTLPEKFKDYVLISQI